MRPQPTPTPVHPPTLGAGRRDDEPAAGPVRRPALRWHGGKWRLAPWIIRHLPPHDAYCESY